MPAASAPGWRRRSPRAGARVDDRRRQGRSARRPPALGERAGFVKLDVTDDAGWEAAVARTVEQLGGLDILVNNAGIEITA